MGKFIKKDDQTGLKIFKKKNKTTDKYKFVKRVNSWDDTVPDDDFEIVDIGTKNLENQKGKR